MTMPLLRRFATILSFSIAAAATGASASTPAAKPPLETRLAASPTTIAMARELVTSLQLSRSGTVRVTPAGSDSAIDDVKAGRADAALIARSLTAEETRSLHAFTLASDSLLLIVNERNPLHELDSATVRRIFSREVSDWKQLGNAGAGSIVPVTRRAGDGTRTTFDNAFGIGRVIPTGIVELATNLAAVLYVAADPQAIGYVSADAYEDARRRGLRIRALRLDGQLPGAKECRKLSYPLCRPIVFVRPIGKPAGDVEQMERFLRSEGGSALIERSGFAGAQQ